MQRKIQKQKQNHVQESNFMSTSNHPWIKKILYQQENQKRDYELTYQIMEQLKKQISSMRALRPAYCNLKIYHDNISKDVQNLQKQKSEKWNSYQSNVSDLFKDVQQTQKKITFYKKEIQKCKEKQKQLKNQHKNHMKQTSQINKKMNKLEEIQLKEVEKLQANMKILQKQKNIEKQVFTQMKLEERQVYKYQGKLQVCLQKSRECNFAISKERDHVKNFISKNQKLKIDFQQKDKQIQKMLEYNQDMQNNIKENQNCIKYLKDKNQQMELNIYAKEQQKKRFVKLINQLRAQNDQKTFQLKIKEQKQFKMIQEIESKNQICQEIAKQIIEDQGQIIERQKTFKKDSQFLTYLKTYQRQLKQSNILLYEKLKENCEQDQVLRESLYKFRKTMGLSLKAN